MRAVSRRGASRFRLVACDDAITFAQRADSCPVTVYKNVTSLKKAPIYKTFTRVEQLPSFADLSNSMDEPISSTVFAHTSPESLQDPEHQYDNWSPSGEVVGQRRYDAPRAWQVVDPDNRGPIFWTMVGAIEQILASAMFLLILPALALIGLIIFAFSRKSPLVSSRRVRPWWEGVLGAEIQNQCGQRRHAHEGAGDGRVSSMRIGDG